MPTDELIINQTRKWIETVVIEHNFCPFARVEFETNRIHYIVVHESSHKMCLVKLSNELTNLDKNNKIETSLIILSKGYKSFNDYLDLVDLSNELLINNGYEGVYQLASFHPLYCFENTLLDDPSNYTNRSVYPMLHIIREASLEKAIGNYRQPELIPEGNIKTTRELGLKKMQAMLNACYDES